MKKDQMVGSRLPHELLKDLEMIEKLEQTDRSTMVRRLLHQAVSEWKREYYAGQYGQGRMTLARAAREAGLSLWEMTDCVRQKRIAAQYDLDDFKKDAKAVLASGQSRPRVRRSARRRTAAK
jgi:predicted HTH domain antitoxin